ncbi:MAG: hypothetical protein LBI91_00240 [Spirochaetaceae bacterium]|nr:hypothetical protein [Spirochaetaceae bacterium]
MRRFFEITALIIIFTGCNTTAPPAAPPQTQNVIQIPAPPPPVRLLTVDIYKRAAPEALQYYISAWIILEYVGIPDYPDTITVRDVVTIPEGAEPGRPYQLRPQDPRAVNPRGVGYIQYENLDRIILIKEQTRGVLLNSRIDETDGRLILDIGFERDNNNTLMFKEDELGEYFYLYPPGTREIQYGTYVYRQLMRERPLLLVRVGENIEDTLRIHTVEGRSPVSGPQN